MLARLRTNKGAAWVELALRNQGEETREPPSPVPRADAVAGHQWSEFLEEPRARLELLDLSYCDYVSHDALVAVLRASRWLAATSAFATTTASIGASAYGDIKQCAAANEPRSPLPEREEIEEMKAAAERRELEAELAAKRRRGGAAGGAR